MNYHRVNPVQWLNPADFPQQGLGTHLHMKTRRSLPEQRQETRLRPSHHTFASIGSSGRSTQSPPMSDNQSAIHKHFSLVDAP